MKEEMKYFIEFKGDMSLWDIRFTKCSLILIFNLSYGSGHKSLCNLALPPSTSQSRIFQY